MDLKITALNSAEQIQKEIQAEHLLISQRLAWLSAVEAFLFAGSIAILRKEIALDLSWVSLPGMLLALFGSFGVTVAIRVQNASILKQKELIDFVENQFTDDSLPEKNLWEFFFSLSCYRRPSGYKTHFVAMLPPLFLPWLIMYLWWFTVSIQVGCCKLLVLCYVVMTFAVLGNTAFCLQDFYRTWREIKVSR